MNNKKDDISKLSKEDLTNLHKEAHKDFKKNASNYGAEDLDYRLENNEVYDDGEVASALESALVSKALIEHSQKMAPQTHPDFNGLNCIDCDEDMPAERLKMGRIRCTECQSHIELLEKKRGY